MKKLFIFLLIFNFKIVSSSEIKFEKFADDLDKPWSLSFINKDSIIFTEKSGNYLLLILRIKKKLKLNIIFLF